MFVARTLPGQHLSGDSKDAVKLGLTLIATLSALVLGLLVASAKGTYDAQNSAVKQISANAILLDRILGLYGSETKEARELLGRVVALMAGRLWPDDSALEGSLAPIARAEMELFYSKVAELSVQNDLQRTLKTRALDITIDLARMRLRMFAQRDGSIPLPFLAILVVWLVVLFGGYGLIAPRNATVVAVLVVCILSASAALYLIVALDRPFEGVLRISSTPVHDALSRIGK